MRGGASQLLSPYFEKLHPKICGGKIPAEQKTRQKVKPACSPSAAGAKCAVVLDQQRIVRPQFRLSGASRPYDPAKKFLSCSELCYNTNIIKALGGTHDELREIAPSVAGKHIITDAELAEALNGHSIAFAFHSGKLENERITYHDTREYSSTTASPPIPETCVLYMRFGTSKMPTNYFCGHFRKNVPWMKPF
jgi:hypothetical protein